MAAALDVINYDENVRSIFVNIFGGITRGEEVAKGIVEGARPGRAAGADRHPPRRHERRGGPPDHPRRRHPGDRKLISKPTMLEAAREAVAHRQRQKGAPDMAIFVDADTKVIVQGLTGGQGKFHGLRNRDYGTQVVGGVTPGKGGQDVEGIPVFDTVAEAVAATGADARRSSPCRRRPRRRRSSRRPRPASAFVVCITEGIPAQDEARVYNTPRARLPGHPPARPELPRHHQPRQVQHRHHRRRDRRAADAPTAPTSASSAAPAR